MPVPDAFPTSNAVSLRDPRRGVWLRLGLKVNGRHPSGDVVVSPGPVQLTHDLAPGAWAEPLSLYFAYPVGSSLTWITAGGPSGAPAPLANLTPLSLQGLPLVSTSLPPGGVITFLASSPS